MLLKNRPGLQDGTHVQITGAEGKTQTLHFHCCMGPEASQEDVLNGCGASQLMDAAMAGYNATIFAYGQTSSGKTHTMFGKEDSSALAAGIPDPDEGLAIRCTRHVFDSIARQYSGQRASVTASCLEVYQEGVYDLLNLSSKQLAMKWDPERGFWVPGLKQVQCTTLEKALQVVRTSVKHRRTGAHALNHESSRSHAILTMTLEIADDQDSSPEFGSVRQSKISFVDLAGSERVKDTGAAGGTLKEANAINKSLFTLGKVISALSEPVRFNIECQLLYSPCEELPLLLSSVSLWMFHCVPRLRITKFFDAERANQRPCAVPRLQANKAAHGRNRRHGVVPDGGMCHARPQLL